MGAVQAGHGPEEGEHGCLHRTEPAKTASPLISENVDAIPTDNIIEICGGRPSAWNYEVLDEVAWSALGSEERREEIRRALKRRQVRRRRGQMRANGPPA
jgi:hypothetical protein